MKNRVFTQNRIVFILVAILLTSVVQGLSYGQGSAKIYWTESDKIRRANLDGSNVEDILTELKWPRDIALDLNNRKMYWIGWDIASNAQTLMERELKLSTIHKL
ncbi:MAG: hypothetical protein OXM61_14655 [Candidatus Poribacteria bacterium]|nr:hypothetical protein [Candidatus Poribacteria bacterium]